MSKANQKIPILVRAGITISDKLLFVQYILYLPMYSLGFSECSSTTGCSSKDVADEEVAAYQDGLVWRCETSIHVIF